MGFFVQKGFFLEEGNTTKPERCPIAMQSKRYHVNQVTKVDRTTPQHNTPRSVVPSRTPLHPRNVNRIRQIQAGPRFAQPDNAASGSGRRGYGDVGTSGT